MRRLLALLVAVALVVLALLVRAQLDEGGDTSAPPILYPSPMAEAEVLPGPRHHAAEATA